MGTNDTQIGVPSGRGAFVSHTYVERDVKTYAIFENEVSHISTFNTLSTVGFSVGSALLAFAVGIWTNWAFVDKKAMPPEGVILSTVVAWGLIVLSVGAFAFAFWARWSRGNTWQAIKEQSKTPRVPPPPPMA